MDRTELVSFLRELLADDLEVAAYRADPESYLARHGLGDLGRTELDEALPEAVAGLDGDRLRLVRPYLDEAGPSATLAEAVAGMLPTDDEPQPPRVDVVIEPPE
ncbi:MAG: hypothetical protein R3290_06310 [Acidimicrobiia bacterium]|nr:hypothetical protein [Acidimicrobiia bacterium]